MPFEVADACSGDYIIIGLNGIVDKKRLKKYPHSMCGLAKVGRLFEILQENSITQIVFAGKVIRPNFIRLIPDKRGFEVLQDIRSMPKKGDNNILNYIISLFTNASIEVLSPQKIAPNLLVKKEEYTKTSNVYAEDIALGIAAARNIGSLDIGQAVIISDSRIVGVEGAEGTSALIKRCKKFCHKGGVLLKMARPNQDSRMDLPAIGLETIQLAHKNNIKCIAIEANNAVFIDKHLAIEYADKNNIVIIGI